MRPTRRAARILVPMIAFLVAPRASAEEPALPPAAPGKVEFARDVQPLFEARCVRNPIDRFIMARLEKDGLQPAPEADRPTLIRRLSLDLLGLPPGPADVQAFVQDNRPGAYERLVDRLLASPHYGERWGRHW